MNPSKAEPTNANGRFMLVKLTTEIADGLEDVRYARQKRERRRVTKRELVQEALTKFIAAASNE